MTERRAKIGDQEVTLETLIVTDENLSRTIFGQLVVKSIFSTDGSLLGEPWGRVAAVDGDPHEDVAFYVVWADGD